MHILQNVGNCDQLKFQTWVVSFQKFSPNKNLTENSLSEENYYFFYLSTWNIMKQNSSMN